MSRPSPTEEDFENLYQDAPCGYLSLSPDAQIVRANRTLAGWLGAKPEQLAGTAFHDILTFGGRIAYETHLAPLLRLQGYVDELAFDLRRPDGTTVPIIANAAEKRDDDGRHLLTRITLFRAIERRRYERSLLDARTRAETLAGIETETAALREQFIAVLGHDLRNPMAAIAAGIGMLKRNDPSGERGQRIVAEMESSVSRADALIADVLDFARGRLGGGLSLMRDSTQPLEPVLDQVVSEMRAIAPEREIIARIAIDQPVDCDRGRIAQLASNLLANAITHGAADAAVEIAAITDDHSFSLSVTNGGAPIAPEARDQLFQPFFRGAARRSQQGLGLGLFIVNEIATAHGGTMTVSSDATRTRFIFSMPLGPHRPSSNEAPPTS